MFYISVSNGILDKQHRQKMQVNQKTSCIWLYLWLLDKMTRVDNTTNLGYVLGGKPLKLEEDLSEFGNRKTVIIILKRLEDEGYIKTLRTPYGKSIFITKAKKIFGGKTNQERSPKSGTSLQESGTSLHQKKQESGTSNKTRQYDKTIKEKQVSHITNLVEEKEMKKNSFKYNESQHEDEFEVVIDLDSGKEVNPTPKVKRRKDADVLELQKAFIEICDNEIGIKPIKDAKGYMAIKNALQYIEFDDIIDMYERWFKSGREREELLSLTACLSHNELNKFRLQKK